MLNGRAHPPLFLLVLPLLVAFPPARAEDPSAAQTWFAVVTVQEKKTPAELSAEGVTNLESVSAEKRKKRQSIVIAGRLPFFAPGALDPFAQSYTEFEDALLRARLVGGDYGREYAFYEITSKAERLAGAWELVTPPGATPPGASAPIPFSRVEKMQILSVDELWSILAREGGKDGVISAFRPKPLVREGGRDGLIRAVVQKRQGDLSGVASDLASLPLLVTLAPGSAAASAPRPEAAVSAALVARAARDQDPSAPSALAFSQALDCGTRPERPALCRWRAAAARVKLDVKQDTDGKPAGSSLRVASDLVAGNRPRAGDAMGMTAVFASDFALSSGGLPGEWAPVDYAVSADLGALTGAQASLSARLRADAASIAADLRAVRPLERTDRSQSFLDEMRDRLAAIPASLASEFQPSESQDAPVPDLGLSQDRLDSVCGGEDACGVPATPNDPPGGGARLSYYRTEESLSPAQALSSAENQASYDAYVDALRAFSRIQRAFDEVASHSARHPKPKKAKLDPVQALAAMRAPGVLAESVQEAYAALDSVFVGAAERFRFDSYPYMPPITDLELVASVAALAAQASDAAARGWDPRSKEEISSRVDELLVQVQMAADISAHPPPNARAGGFHAPRVGQAFTELATSLRAVKRMVAPLAPSGVL